MEKKVPAFYSMIASDVNLTDDTHLVFSTKGKENWNALFSQLILAQEGEDSDISVLS